MDTQPVVEADLVGGAAQLLKKAESWYTIAYEVEVQRLRKVSDGEDDEGQPVAHMEPVVERNLVVRGRRGEGMFLAVWASGKADVAYWWTREHEAWADLPRELVRWTTPVPTPVKVSFAELKRKVSE